MDQSVLRLRDSILNLFDFEKVPFSRHQRFITISMMVDNDGEKLCYLRFVKNGDEKASLGRLCKIQLVDLQDTALSHEYSLTPDCLVINGSKDSELIGTCEFVIGDGELVHIKAKNCLVRFTLVGSRYDYAYNDVAGQNILVAAAENVKLSPVIVNGELALNCDWQQDHSDNICLDFIGSPMVEGSISIFERVKAEHSEQSFDEARRSVKAEFDKWFAKTGSVSDLQYEAQQLAAYILWSNCVPKSGLLTRPSIFMSKNRMINIWSWDNVFSAIGVASIDKQLAYDQFAVIFDHQDKTGLLPDFVNDKYAAYSFTKPPVHGWALSLILESDVNFLNNEQQLEMLNWLELQLDYWLVNTRKDTNMLPSYYHGNDSGWDNASFFDRGGPVEAPDLVTFLILTADMIKTIYIQRELTDKAAKYEAIATILYDLLINRLWDGSSFRAKLLHSPKETLPNTSLIQFMPLLLGKRLDKDIVALLLKNLDDLQIITKWGAASESPISQYYESNGYWRGPIWAPTSLLLFSGLMKQNQTDRATSLATKYCNTCELSGMAENFDALTGQGLCDPAFAWTSAVYLHFSKNLLNQSGV